ncbi:proto-oncogene tyrosine-protein kinase receptor Ret-like isoform X2 [Liolophura sinensis]|uniref:proto-oncogene tyrosine-protein kinase receptor Ret-like isoform X2 n=1 Tax=Liolophura sinensis TaxID=3198878 RepID=UPI003158F2FA
MRNSTGMFKVTLKTGIIYVNDPDILLATPHVINVTIQFRSATGQKTILVAVNVIPNHFKQRLQCNGTCSSHRTETECETSCGLGAVRGRCVMRRETRLDRHTKDYGTCSPNLITCPDSVCDELEEENELLCPQDCTQDHVKGAVLRSGNEDSRGIQRAAGTCYCNIMASCQCWANKTFYQATEDRMSGVDTLPSAHLEETHPTVPGPLTSGTSGVTEASGVTKDMDDDSLCDTTCKTIIGLVIVTVVVVLLIFFLVWCIQKRRKRRTDKLRHVGSNVSMNAIPSDYVEERRTSHNSIEWSPKIINTQNGYDKKWEFPRKNLILGKNLGEGEFGQVVQAKAYHISPCEEYSPVAVKMLKNCSNETEYQDLLSEFNLLKDVSHPNVIKLLGACTKEEPLYIIVEYCEYGSLRHYLRSCRHNNALSMEGQDISSGQSKSLTKYSLSTRELLSFAWQIAKGMHYLAEMKVVHRDLAARNVLVASGKVVKISDFGLSRDVYEADAYMKKSKGRIPVKWMAPESLYDQVYTIKSDVWSYGIVLWEIVTLGATPYPGIPPERLFGLLKSGYRMDRPENCSDELYAVMQKCWKAEPQRRPYFIDLVNIFDSMLQAKMEYLDLNGAFRAPFEQDNDLSLDGLTSGSPARHCCLLGMDQTYGNINFKTDSSSYLTPTFKTEQLINRENNSRGKTFPKNECLQAGQIHRQFHGRVKLDYEVDMEDDVFEAQETDSLRCTKV